MAIKTGPTRKARATARKVVVARANARALQLASVIAEIRANDVKGPQAIAKELNKRGIPTPRGSRFWQDMQVRNLLARLNRLQEST